MSYVTQEMMEGMQRAIMQRQEEDLRSLRAEVQAFRMRVEQNVSATRADVTSGNQRVAADIASAKAELAGIRTEVLAGTDNRVAIMKDVTTLQGAVQHIQQELARVTTEHQAVHSKVSSIKSDPRGGGDLKNLVPDKLTSLNDASAWRDWSFKMRIYLQQKVDATIGSILEKAEAHKG